jgi:hypothetical protein
MTGTIQAGEKHLMFIVWQYIIFSDLMRHLVKKFPVSENTESWESLAVQTVIPTNF